MDKAFILVGILWGLYNLFFSFLKYYIGCENFIWKDFLMQLFATLIFAMVLPLIAYALNFFNC